ncbi:Cytochrome P450 [Glarea lozoyensis ATCC 20868]|uniref:Cytochrome P450 n=1 Tax=Glarea lozoyensis (strain ATCC 20868 / MF5171) TaxID=1116229 RepID=S3DD46_GLAL2|nr:Cytochrome P450 [Glarea lozoyensis ATCC 20868]EPE35655.1 Cytochrome P450 [Glarea lozoyensis ATCC 20868]
MSWTKLRYAEETYGDTFLLISPFLCYLKTSNAELITQITSRRSDFVKPVTNYKVIDILGGSIVTAEGHEWKRHKKIVGPSFSEKSNKMVFEESLRQTNGMLETWRRGDGNTMSDFRVENSNVGTATLSLHVICAAGFGVPQLWPWESEEKLNGKELSGYSGDKLLAHHTMSMKDALTSLLKDIYWFAIPSSPSQLSMHPVTSKLYLLTLSEYLPFSAPKRALKAFNECKAYFTELVEIKKKELYLGESEKGTMDLLGPMLRASTEGSPDLQLPDPQSYLTKEEIIGNSFIFLFAGHETSANSIHFTLLFLAISLATQRKVQADIDAIVGDLPAERWDYHTHMPKLYNSMVGASLNEQMRLVPAICSIPKISSGDQNVRVDGRDFVIPDDTFIHINVVGTNRNPRYWPKFKSQITGKEHDMDDFVPERWLNGAKRESSDKLVDGLETASFETSTATSLRGPEKGAFMTFSDGPRACPGRRFAQVEITAVLAAIFQRYSVELDVGEWASEKELKDMGKVERKALYDVAIQSAREKIRRSRQNITLQLARGDRIPLRFVRKGGERFGL